MSDERKLTAEQVAGMLLVELSEIPDYLVRRERLGRTLESYAAERVAEEQRRCVEAAKNARLPDDYQWGEDAMEQFNFGKERAAEEIGKRGQK